MKDLLGYIKIYGEKAFIHKGTGDFSYGTKDPLYGYLVYDDKTKQLYSFEYREGGIISETNDIIQTILKNKLKNYKNSVTLPGVWGYICYKANYEKKEMNGMVCKVVDPPGSGVIIRNTNTNPGVSADPYAFIKRKFSKLLEKSDKYSFQIKGMKNSRIKCAIFIEYALRNKDQLLSPEQAYIRYL